MPWIRPAQTLKSKQWSFRSDSPGGEITASDVLYNSLKEFSKEKPTVIYFNSIGASGAYYAACGASYIMCNSTTLPVRLA